MKWMKTLSFMSMPVTEDSINIWVKNEEREEVQQILKSNSNKDQLLSVNEISEKEHLMLSAMEVLYDSSKSKYFHLQSSAESRLGWESSLFVYVLVKRKRAPS
ncbi:hypothetical protein L1987_86953 [Smallanthus sonchifolius]|uniref:Uncharacterized protein n=1 Tax=Smallanthus sonchifolius TaxID=185202 RepID=A0ACB8Y1K6_9ASTR|nr:hypothetical protein L1987_86953 [Smallanthus sonchifolius]